MNYASPRRVPSRQHGFSLVEILVSVAIIALLSALLFPAVKEQIRKSRQAKLAANMKSIAAGLMLYANDNDGRLPATTKGSVSWQKSVMFYLGEDNLTAAQYKRSLLHDPLDTTEYIHNGVTRSSLNIAMNGSGSWDMNADPPKEPSVSGASYRLISSIAQPSRLLMLTTGESNLDSYAGYTMRLNSNAFRGNADPSKLTRILGHHMCCFADGHVELIPLSDILKEVELDRASISRSVFFDAKGNNGQGPN